MCSDVRWVYAINGNLRPDKRPVVYKTRATGELIHAGGLISSKEPTDIVYPLSGGVVCQFKEMNFMVNYFLKETFKFFSLKTFYNVAIPVVTTLSERNALLNSFSTKQIKTILIPEVISSILNESHFGLIYLAHSFTEITIVENGTVKAFTFDNIGLDNLANHILKGVSPSLKRSMYLRRKALESLVNEHDVTLIGPDANTNVPLEVTVTMSDFLEYSTPWIRSIRELFTKQYLSNYKWYIISDYGKLNYIATIISDECSVKIHPVNDSQELIAKELSVMHI